MFLRGVLFSILVLATLLSAQEETSAPPVPPPVDLTTQPDTTPASTVAPPTPAPPNCSNGYLFNENTKKCYKQYTTQLWHGQASSLCAQDGAILAHVNNEMENAHWLNSAAGRDLWTGLWCSNNSISSCYYKDDGAIPRYTNFLREPDVSVGNCVLIYGISGVWASADCNNYQASFVCEYDPRIEVCGFGWKVINGSCFKIISNGHMLHSEAQSVCFSYSSQIASIHSQEENTALLEMVRSASPTVIHMWIGLRRIGSSQTFEWSDGSALDYENWINGGPSGSKNNMWGKMIAFEFNVTGLGKWSDNFSGVTSSVICKKPLTV